MNQDEDRMLRLMHQEGHIQSHERYEDNRGKRNHRLASWSCATLSTHRYRRCQLSSCHLAQPETRIKLPLPLSHGTHASATNGERAHEAIGHAKGVPIRKDSHGHRLGRDGRSWYKGNGRTDDGDGRGCSTGSMVTSRKVSGSGSLSPTSFPVDLKGERRLRVPQGRSSMTSSEVLDDADC